MKIEKICVHPRVTPRRRHSGLPTAVIPGLSRNPFTNNKGNKKPAGTQGSGSSWFFVADFTVQTKRLITVIVAAASRDLQNIAAYLENQTIHFVNLHAPISGHIMF
jgi:hypothetical protein